MLKYHQIMIIFQQHYAVMECKQSRFSRELYLTFSATSPLLHCILKAIVVLFAPLHTCQITCCIRAQVANFQIDLLHTIRSEKTKTHNDSGDQNMLNYHIRSDD